MRPFPVSVCLLVLFLCGSTLHAQTPDGSPLADTPWPTYGQNLQRTGLSTLTGPDDPVAEWSYRRAGSSSVNGSAAMGADSTLYIGMGNALVAVNPNGTEKWSYETELTIWSSPAVAEDGTIYIGDGTSNTLSSSGSLYALNVDGTLKWRFQIEGTGAVSSPPAIGPDGTIYAGSYDDTLYAINPDGSLRWSFSVDGDIVGAPVLSNDGHLYVGTRSGTLYALMASGEQLWTFDTGSSIIYTPALTADGILYVAAGGSLIAVGTDGEVRWTFSAPSSITSPALGPEGDIYVGSGRYLLAVSSEGEQQWSFELSDNAYGDPAVDADGTVFIPTFDRYVFAVNPDGTEQWRLSRGYSPYSNTSSPIVGPDSRIYIGATQYAYQYPDGYTYFESLIAIGQKPPEPVLSVTPEGTIDFGDVPIGESATKYITVANTGDAVLTVEDLYMYSQGSSNDYSTDTEVPFTIEPGASREVGIVLTPTEPSTRSAQLSVRSDGGSAYLRLIANESPPIANNDTTSTAIDTPLEVPMMENDYYGGYTSPEIVTPPANGTAEIGYAERSENPVFIEYTPPQGFEGRDTLQYRLSNSDGTSEPATVYVTVGSPNSPPSAQADTAETVEGTPVTVDVLANDEDPDGDPLQITATSDTELGGSVTVSEDGQRLSYTPPEGISGTDYFSYRISDPDAATDDATVTVMITAVNDAPVAVNDTVATDEDQQIGYLNVLANDSDPDDDPLTLTDVSTPGNGSASIIDNGIRYTPDADFFGDDAFTYTVSDGNGATDEATVVVTVRPVNDAPVFTSEPPTQARRGEVYTYEVRATDIDNEELTLTLPTHPEWLQIEDSGDGTGTLSGTPGPQDAGSFDVVIEASDADASTEQSFSITVEDVNQGPIAVNDTVTTDEDIPVAIDVLANDSSPSDDTLEIADVLDAATGAVQIQEGQVRYVPPSDFYGRDSLRYAIQDDGGLRDTAWAFITVTPINDAPVAHSDTVSTQARTAVLIDVLANDNDVDDDVLVIAVDGSTEHGGTVSVTEDNRIRYTPPAGFQGTDRFTYTVRDAAEASDQGQVVIRVQAVNFTITDLGTLDGGSVSAAFDVNDDGDIIGAATDADGRLRPFRWRAGRMQALSIPEAVEAQALAVSSDGTVVGLARRSDSTSYAFRLPAGSGRAEALGTLGGTFSAAYAVNDSGAIAGTASLLDDRTFRAFRWTENGIDGLSIPSAEHSEGFAINNASLVAGTAQLASGIRRAFVGTELLEDGDESRAYGLNSSAWLVGSIRQGDAVVPYLWRPEGDPLPLPVLAGSFGEAYAVNDAGWIVGTSSTADDPSERLMARWLSGPTTSFRHTRSVLTLGQAAGKAAAPEMRAALWIDGQLYDLNTLVSEGAEWRLDEARSINSRGQIVGYGRRNGERRAFLLTPTDNAPPTAQNDVISETGGSGPLTLDVLANDTDVDGDALALVDVSAPRHGTAVIADGRITYRPSAGHSRDEFTYTISDGRGSTATASVMLRLDAGAPPLTELVLRSNYPNPFQTETVIEYTLPRQGPVRLEVFNMLGQRVAVLVDGVQEAGPKRRAFQPAASLPDGTYFYRLHWNGQNRTRSFTLIR